MSNPQIPITLWLWKATVLCALALSNHWWETPGIPSELWASVAGSDFFWWWAWLPRKYREIIPWPGDPTELCFLLPSRSLTGLLLLLIWFHPCGLNSAGGVYLPLPFVSDSIYVTKNPNRLWLKPLWHWIISIWSLILNWWAPQKCQQGPRLYWSISAQPYLLCQLFLSLLPFDGKVAASAPAIMSSHKNIQGRKEEEGVVSSIKGNFYLFCQEAKSLSANLSLCLVG